MGVKLINNEVYEIKIPIKHLQDDYGNDFWIKVENDDFVSYKQNNKYNIEFPEANYSRNSIFDGKIVVNLENDNNKPNSVIVNGFSGSPIVYITSESELNIVMVERANMEDFRIKAPKINIKIIDTHYINFPNRSIEINSLDISEIQAKSKYNRSVFVYHAMNVKIKKLILGELIPDVSYINNIKEIECHKDIWKLMSNIDNEYNDYNYRWRDLITCILGRLNVTAEELEALFLKLQLKHGEEKTAPIMESVARRIKKKKAEESKNK